MRNIELQRRVVAAVNAREVPEEILAPGFWMENRASSVTDYTYHGAAGWRDWMNDIFEEFAPNARYQLDDILATGEDFVIAAFCIAGRSARSGEPLEFRWTGVTWFRDAHAIRAVGYANRGEAFAAASSLERDRRRMSLGSLLAGRRQLRGRPRSDWDDRAVRERKS